MLASPSERSRSCAPPPALRHLASTQDPGCLVDPGGTILLVNEAWERLALERGAGDRCLADALVGTRWLDQISGDAPRRLLRGIFARAVARFRSGSAAPAVVVVEANDAAVARLVATRLVPVVPAPGVLAGVAVEHRTVRELPVGAVHPVVRRPPAAYRNAGGEIEQCSCCRRTRRPDAWSSWDLVPDLVAFVRPETAFVLCPACLDRHSRELPER
jgi:hypothetical protein